MTSNEPRASSESRTLHPDALGLGSVLYLSMAGAAVLAAVITNVPLIASQAGASVPLVFVAAGVGLLSFTPAIVSFSRRSSSAGGFASWIATGLGTRAGLLSGWLMAGGYTLFTTSVLILLGSLLQSALSSYLHFNIPGGWVTYTVLATLLTFGAAVLDISLASRGVVIFMLLELITLLILDTAITLKGGAHGHDLSPWSLAGTSVAGAAPGGLLGLLDGMVLGVWMFVGFDTSAVYGEEARRPRVAVPVALLFSILVLLLLYLWSSYSAVIGFGWEHAADQLGKGGYQSSYQLGARYVGGWFAEVMNILNISSNLACALAFALACGRYLFDLGRKQLLPSQLGSTHPRWKSPHKALLVQALFTLVLVLLLALVQQKTQADGGTSYRLSLSLGEAGWSQTDGTNPYLWLSTTGTMAILLVYILVNLAAVRAWLRQDRQAGRLKLPSLVCSALALLSSLIFALPLASFILPAIPGTVGNYFTSLGFAATPFPLNILPLLVLLWVLGGALLLLRLSSRTQRTPAESVQEE
ncbi:APC family permease [Ktedonosporobacter rubrisoli]|nr:APC family permease [Ktedonosporobacter rubrisoli]